MKRNELRHILKDHFSLDEIIGITFDLGIDHESLPGMTKDAKARELIAACERRGLISDLEAHIHRQLPHLAWHSNGSVVVMMQNNSMPKLTQPSGFDPFGEPDCESDLELLGAAEYSHFYFANTRFSSEALDRKVYLIVGRRGSGKTALAHYFSFQRQILNAVAVDVDEPSVFHGIVSRVAQQDMDSREIAVPRLVRIWEYVVWSIIFRTLRHSDSRIKAACAIQDNGQSDSEYIRALLNSLLAAKPYPGEVDTHMRSEVVRDAQTAVLTAAARTPVIVALDTLENYTLSDESMLRVTAALVAFGARFNRDFAARNLHVKLFLMAEVFPKLREEAVLNTLKHIKDVMYLHWRPKDLMRMICWRFWNHLRAEKIVTGKQSIDWHNPDEVKREVWNPYFGAELVNRVGVIEPTFPYILRHTQLRPRQLIVACNSIASLALKRGNFPKFTQSDITDGVLNAELDLADEVFNSYNTIYPNAGKIADAMTGMPNIFLAKKLDERARQTKSQWINGYDLSSFRRLMVELGIVGRIRSRNDDQLIIEADFEYAKEDSLSLLNEDECVVHPMFYDKLGIKIVNKSRIYPFPDHEEFKYL